MKIPGYVIKHLNEFGNTVLPNSLIDKNSKTKVINALKKLGIECKIEESDYTYGNFVPRSDDERVIYINYIATVINKKTKRQ